MPGSPRHSIATASLLVVALQLSPAHAHAEALPRTGAASTADVRRAAGYGDWQYLDVHFFTRAAAALGVTQLRRLLQTDSAGGRDWIAQIEVVAAHEWANGVLRQIWRLRWRKLE